MPTSEQVLANSAATTQSLDESRRRYEAARQTVEQVVGAEADTDHAQAVQDAQAALLAAESDFHNSLRALALSVRNGARSL
jgi:hypothetical protein